MGEELLGRPDGDVLGRLDRIAEVVKQMAASQSPLMRLVQMDWRLAQNFDSQGSTPEFTLNDWQRLGSVADWLFSRLRPLRDAITQFADSTPCWSKLFEMTKKANALHELHLYPLLPFSSLQAASSTLERARNSKSTTALSKTASGHEFAPSTGVLREPPEPGTRSQNQSPAGSHRSLGGDDPPALLS